jgi:hypothetical protein
MNHRQKNNAMPEGPVVNWPLIVCHFLALPPELVLHKVTSFGVRSVAPRIGGALLLMFLFVAFHPGENCLPLICFMIAVIALGLVAQISALLRKWRGEQGHSRYSGRPYAMWLAPFVSEMAIKRLEPFVVLMAGWGIHHINHPLGSFLIAAAVGLGVRIGSEHRGNYARVMDMNDALIEQRIAMNNLRNMQRR